MWKQIEKYIRDHREALDRDLPGEHLWARIEADLDQQPRGAVKPFRALDNFWRVAAAIVLVLGGAWLWFRAFEQPQTMPAALMPVIDHAENVSLPWDQAEAAYLDQVNALLGKMEEKGLADLPEYEQMAAKIDQVEQQLQELRQIHGEVNNQDSLLQELKQLQTRHLDLLQQLLEQRAE